jgi:hypothetical protein
MTKPDYSWREWYLHAVLETDPHRKFVQICEAFAAIEQRRLSPIETDEERWELANVEEGIKGLIAERGMKLV